MTVASQINKLRKAKTQIRKALQAKGQVTTGTFDSYDDLVTAIQTKTISSGSLGDYAQDINSKIELNVTSIRDYAFANYTSLRAVVLNSSSLVALKGTHVFSQEFLEKGYVYVPANMVDTYKNATNWIDLADRIKAYEDVENTTQNLIENIDRAMTIEQLMTLTLEDFEDRR